MDTIYNEDCMNTMSRLEDGSVDVVLTSPPYNTERKVKSGEDHTERSIKAMNVFGRYADIRYDAYEGKDNEAYIDWTVELFNHFDRILKSNGCVVYNISYGGDTWEQQSLMWRTVARVIERTSFCTADRIIWKKNSALPNNVSSNKLTRICEDVFIFCRKSEYGTFFCNKEVVSVRPNGQKMYENIFNMVSAKNNDEICPYNKATYSTDLCRQLLKIYGHRDAVIYDPFMGSGTTAIACIQSGMNYIGSELSENQCRWAEDRIRLERNEDQISFFETSFS